MVYSTNPLNTLINPIMVLILQRWNTELHKSKIVSHIALVNPGWTAALCLLEHGRTQLNFLKVEGTIRTQSARPPGPRCYFTTSSSALVLLSRGHFACWKTFDIVICHRGRGRSTTVIQWAQAGILLTIPQNTG